MDERLGRLPLEGRRASLLQRRHFVVSLQADTTDEFNQNMPGSDQDFSRGTFRHEPLCNRQVSVPACYG